MKKLEHSAVFLEIFLYAHLWEMIYHVSYQNSQGPNIMVILSYYFAY